MKTPSKSLVSRLVPIGLIALIVLLIFWKNRGLDPEETAAPDSSLGEKTVVSDVPGRDGAPVMRTRVDRSGSPDQAVVSTAEPAPPRPREGERPAYWKTDAAPAAAPVVPSGFALSPPSAVASIGKMALKPAVHQGTFERVALIPSGRLKVDFVWPLEHKIGQVAVRGLHGGTIDGQVGRVLDVKRDGSFSFIFQASGETGHDEIVLTAANVSFNMPVWVKSPDGGIPAPATINP